MRLSEIKVFPIDDEDRFEEFCKDLYGILFNDENAQRNGRKGQGQNGVDVFCHYGMPFLWVGIQCKVRNSDNKLSISDIKKEIEKAKTFNPKLDKYIISTTCNRDSQILEEIRRINDELSKESLFSIKIDFWEDLQEYMSDNKYEYVLIKYYSDFIIDSLKYGFSVGRLVTVLLGIEDDYNTQHELLIAKIPEFAPGKETGIAYFQDRYVVLDLNSRHFSIIQDSCFPSDFEETIETYFDQELISKWLRESDIMEIIYSDKKIYYSSFTKEEHKNFLGRQK